MLKKLHRTVLFVEVSAEQENSCAEYWLQASPIAYQILTEPDGDRALERCQQQRIDAVILRLAAHALSLEAISQLQQLGDRCPPIVVIDQGAGAVETAVQALKAGATDYLAADKVTPERLQRSLQMAIEAVAQQRAERWSQEQFYALVENMVDCCGIFSAIRDRSGQITDFRIDYLNRAAWEANQMPRSAQVGKNLCNLLPAHRTSGLFAAYCQVVETGEPLIKDSLVYDDFFGQQRLVRAFDLRAAKLRDGFVASWRDITARKHLELNLSQTAASLQQEQSRLQQLIQQAPIGIGIGTASGDVKVINDAMLELHGYTRAEFEQNGMNWRDFTPPELMESTQQAMDQLRQEEAIVAEEKEILRRDGTRVPIWISAVRWLGHPDEHVAFAIDIRDRKQIETSLLQSEAYFRQLADSAPMMIWVTDATGYCTYLSQGWYAFTGQTEATGLGFGWLTAVHPEDRELAEKLFRDANKQNESFRLEYRLRHQDGEYRWTIDAASPRFSQEGEFQGYIGSVVDISDRKQSEVALKESEERFRTLADNISQFTWMANESGWIFWYNRRWFDYTGTTLAEMQGWGWQQVHHPDYVEEVTAKFRRHVESGEAWEDTFPLRGKDGQYRWFLSRAVPICDEQGRVLRWFGTNTDVTDLRQAEMDLQQTSERLKITLRSAPITLFNQDLDLRYTWIYNPTHRYATPEVMGQQDADLVSPQSAAYLTELKRRVIETGESLREEVEVVRGKQIAYYDLTVDPLRDENNTIIGITGAAVDISQKTQLADASRQAQVKLQQSEDRLRMAVEAARLGTWDWNLVTDELIWDVGCKAMFGLPADAEVNIEIYYHSLHPEDRDRMEQIVQWALNPDSQGDFDAEYRVIGVQDQVERWIAAKGQVSFDVAGTPQRFTGIVLDITEQKQAEAEREQLLQREQAAREEAERANRIKDEFLAVLSHELRSPLNPILGWTHLLQTRKLDEAKTAKALETIERNTKLQTQLIDDLLDIAKILRGKLSLTIAAVNLAPVIEAAIETLMAAALAKAITIKTVLPDIGPVAGDAGRLQQIVWNLLSNAIKFTPRQGQVDILLEVVDNQAQITVRDTGKGISHDFLPYIFESFRQEDFSITRQYGGLGLGLAIVRQLVEAHGGTISASSPGLDLGATFTVRLPLPADMVDQFQADSAPPQTADLTGIQVLVVDDEADARELLVMQLAQYGAEVKIVSSAVEAIESLQTIRPDVLVSDIGMPEVDGYALMRQVRALPPEAGGTLPAIALTAYAREEDLQQAIASGFQRHIAKPLEPLALAQAIAELVRRSSPKN